MYGLFEGVVLPYEMKLLLIALVGHKLYYCSLIE